MTRSKKLHALKVIVTILNAQYFTHLAVKIHNIAKRLIIYYEKSFTSTS